MRRSVVRLLGFALLVSSVARGDLEDEITRQWAGSWVLTRLETRSGCGGFFTDNEVAGSIARGRGDQRFDAGELGQVRKIDLHRKAVDLMIAYDEPVLIPYQDGPFTLYREASCKVELEVALDRDLVKGDRIDAIDRRLEDLLERHPTRNEALDSALWNRRERDPYPEDYEETLADHAVWQAEQANLSVQARLDESVRRLAELPERLERDPAYLDGFAAGVDSLRYETFYGCPGLIDQTPSYRSPSPPSEYADEKDLWKRGFEDGREHAFELEMLWRLPACFVPVPYSD